mmetsp:Transcript_15329/g.14911  ORF Transcript_15329/g.14911 Transcript_15329/m.14911 type:complete len:151 (+) Transcript_15329:1213-1665(+)
MEQSFHKPPISHSYIIGPDEIYKFSGYSHYSVKAHLNSIDLIVEGGKTIVFKDGSIIKYNNLSDIFQNTFFGTLSHQMTGRIDFKDEKNGIHATIDIGKIKKKAQDFFIGTIKKHGIPVSEIRGNYLGFVDFDKVRYWDARDTELFEVTP